MNIWKSLKVDVFKSNSLLWIGIYRNVILVASWLTILGPCLLVEIAFNYKVSLNTE